MGDGTSTLRYDQKDFYDKLRLAKGKFRYLAKQAPDRFDDSQVYRNTFYSSNKVQGYESADAIETIESFDREIQVEGLTKPAEISPKPFPKGQKDLIQPIAKELLLSCNLLRTKKVDLERPETLNLSLLQEKNVTDKKVREFEN